MQANKCKKCRLISPNSPRLVLSALAPSGHDKGLNVFLREQVGDGDASIDGQQAHGIEGWNNEMTELIQQKMKLQESAKQHFLRNCVAHSKSFQASNRHNSDLGEFAQFGGGCAADHGSVVAAELLKMLPQLRLDGR